MDCLIEFLSEHNQKKIRSLAQIQNEEYEKVLDKYKELFIAYFKYTITKECDRESKVCRLGSRSECGMECGKIRSTLNQIQIEEIEEFFNKIKEVYIDWIDAKLENAIQKFNELMKQYQLDECLAEHVKNDILFKGRKSKDILTKWEMFHIPFNKRYLIGNQRYSLTGQPLIYLGKSVVDVIEELDFNKDEIEELQLSSFQIKHDLKIYDLRNNIFGALDELELQLLFDEEAEFSKETFFKGILASICSFEKRKERQGFSFCEEYVVPQILAQSLKNKGYDGITYYSTKRFQGISRVEAEKKPSINLSKLEYKENIAVFTNFNENHVYDKNLYGKLKISVPIDIKKIEQITVERLEELAREIEATRDQEKITKAGKILQVFKREFADLTINEKKYCETSVGMLHIYHIYVILSEILIENKEEE